MKKGEFPDGSRTLRAKIDMASPNLNMRDPVMYRILHATHPHTGDEWCVYPMYDWAHGLEDSIEKVTHSICTLEFENHRPLYDWFIDQLGIYHPQQIEFARLNLTYTVMSKRKLLQLVKDGLVRVGTIRACPPSAVCAEGLHTRGDLEFLPPNRREQITTASWTSSFWSTASARILTSGLRE